MTHPIYSQTTLEALNTSQVKAIAKQIGAIPDGDKRVKQVWVSAVLDHQIKFSPAKVGAIKTHVLTVMTRIEEARVVTAVKVVPQELVEAQTLTMLGIGVTDKEDDIDEVIPHGELRWYIRLGDKCIGAISSWFADGRLSYHNPISHYRGYSSLFEAITSFLSRGEVALAYSDAQTQLRERFAAAPDYI